MAASPSDVEEFLQGPLVTWLGTCVKKPEQLQVYENFYDGSPITEVLLQIDPEPSLPVPTATNLQGLSVAVARIKIFHCIIKNIKNIYEEELGQLIITLPDCVTIGKSPASLQALEHLRLLLLLLLGCAVQGPTKEIFITKIKELSLEAQHDIVECIKQVTDDQNMVLTQDLSEQSSDKLYSHLRNLAVERDNLFHNWIVDLGQDSGANSTIGSSGGVEGIQSNHLAVELADWKARLRKLRQELDEKSELLTECREELDHTNQVVSKLKIENGDLILEARKAKLYRDEVDAMREKADRADKLEFEVQRYREKLADAEFYKVRVDELREDNRVLIETREMLEAQLIQARQRTNRILELEAELLTAKQTVNDVAIERDVAKERIQELIDENLQLQQVTKDVLNESSLKAESNEEMTSMDNSLSEQLTNNAQARALKLELENRKLVSMIESLKEQSFHESSKNILELEKEKKKLSLKVEQLQENCERLTQQHVELENLFRNALQESRKLQDSLDTAKIMSDRHQTELQNEKTKIAEFEKNIENLTKEKQRVQSLCETVKRRADDAEKSLNQTTEKLDNLQTKAERVDGLDKKCEEFQKKVNNLEKENGNLHKDVLKLKEIIEEKDVKLDQYSETCEKFEKEIEKLTTERESINSQIEKLQEYEKRSQELISQATVYTETISTLQKDLISEKINNEKLKVGVEKLGLDLDVLENDMNVIVERMIENSPTVLSIFKKSLEGRCEGMEKMVRDVEREPDILSQTEQVVSSISAEWNKQCEKLCSELAGAQQTNKQLQTENAKMLVNITTLTSQVNTLTAQQMALQLANSQLVAEKDELAEQQKLQNKEHDTLLLDQLTIRTLHEQLTGEYEQLKRELESVRKLNRDLRSEIRTLKDSNVGLEKKLGNLEQEKNVLNNDTKTLGNLRAEHSKLKDDFRNLFTANERLKSEYRGLQEEYRNLKAEMGRLRIGNTEMQGELSTRSDMAAGLQLENAKLQQKCDMLFEMNHNLDADRRALMDHVSQLLAQYHSLLTHSLEDKQQYHMEEKLFTDKLNNLCRQKEKLEEKIMEHYRKLDNASAKKKGFGATLVRRVRKASSDIINKTTRNRRSWHEDGTSRLNQSQFTIGTGSGESGGNDSDNSLEDPVQRAAAETASKRSAATGSLHGHKPRDEIALRRGSHRDVASHRNSVAGDIGNVGSALSLGSVGTRRTVYLSEDEPPASSSPQPSQQTVTSSAGANPPGGPLLVFNKISTVYNEPPKLSEAVPVATTTTTNRDNSLGNERKKPPESSAKESAIWYEYGCV